MILSPSKNPVSDILYVYNSIWIGSYEQESFQTTNFYTYSETHDTPYSKTNYSQYSKMDTVQIKKFLESDGHIFSISGGRKDYTNIGMFWFSCDKNGKLEKYDKYKVQTNIFELTNETN